MIASRCNYFFLYNLCIDENADYSKMELLRSLKRRESIMTFNTLGFIGLGLIGGSIAKKMKKNNLDIKIIATAHHKETIEQAYHEGLIENQTLLPLDAFRKCDCIFLCAPVQRNIDYLRQLKNIIPANC